MSIKEAGYLPLLGPDRLYPEELVTIKEKRPANISLIKSLSEQARDRMRLFKHDLFDLFGIKHTSQISELYGHPEKKEEINQRFIQRYKEYILSYQGSNSYKELLTKNQDSDVFVEHLISDSLIEADSIINELENRDYGMLNQYSTSIGVTSELVNIQNPADLLLLSVSPNIPNRLKYEAKRKLVLMDLSLHRILETADERKQMDTFLRFLGDTMWPESRVANDVLEVVTDHSPIDYACRKVEVLEANDKPYIHAFRRYTRFDVRSWMPEAALASAEENKKKPVYLEQSIHNRARVALRMLQEDTLNPQDLPEYARLRLVFSDKKDILLFLGSLQERSKTTKFPFSFTHITDNIDPQDSYRTGQSRPESFNIQCSFKGSVFNLQLHTIRTYMDGRLRDGVSNEETMIRNNVEKGVVDLLYPEDIYGDDSGDEEVQGRKQSITRYLDTIIQDTRSRKRYTALDLPPHRRPESRSFKMYLDSDLIADVEKIINQMRVDKNFQFPDVVLAVESKSAFAAQVLTERLGNASELLVYSNNDHQIHELRRNKNRNILIVDDVGFNLTKVRHLKSLLEARVSVLIKKEGISPEKEALIDYYGRTISKDDWMKFFWEQPDAEDHFPKVQSIAVIYKTDKEGNLLLLAEHPLQRGDDQTFKLPGGSHEPTIDGPNLTSTIIRELQEEAHKKISPDRLSALGDIPYSYSDGPNSSSIRFGVARAFAIKAGRNERFDYLDTTPGEEAEYVWVKPEEFMQNSRRYSYQSAVQMLVERERERHKDISRKHRLFSF